MKPFLVFLLLVLYGSGVAEASQTTYEALQRLTAKQGSSVLENVYVVRGTNGSPQPSRWSVYRGDPLDRDFRETVIPDSGRITFSVIPTRNAGLLPHAQRINFSVLNVDSDAAWQIARREARREKFQFERADYELKTIPLAGVPAWSLVLYNDRQKYLGELTISGATGEVLYPLKLSRFTKVEVDGRPELVTVREPWSRRAARSVGRWFSQTANIFGHDLLRAAGTAEDIIVGKRTRPYSEDTH